MLVVLNLICPWTGVGRCTVVPTGTFIASVPLISTLTPGVKVLTPILCSTPSTNNVSVSTVNSSSVNASSVILFDHTGTDPLLFNTYPSGPIPNLVKESLFKLKLLDGIIINWWIIRGGICY